MIRLVLVDDQELVRDGIALLLGRNDDMEVVGVGSNGHDAIRLVRELNPDVVLMDVRMPGLDGLSAARRVLAERPQTRVLVLRPSPTTSTWRRRCGWVPADSSSRTRPERP
ncbi:MAG: response regulator transcription factor [Dermatophilaceae bacterium]